MKHIFIVNPIAGNVDKSEEIKEEVKSLRDELGIDVLFFIVEYEGHEAYIVEKICDAFHNDPMRIYCCGGSGSFQRILEAAKNFSNVELACYPCGFTNDLLKCFTNKEDFYKLRNIVEGVPISLDVAQFDGRLFCNALSIGMTARVIGDIDNYAFITQFNRNFPYWFSSMVDVFTKRDDDYEIEIDGIDYSGKYLLVSAFNGCTYGGNISPVKNARPNDGYLDFIMFRTIRLFDGPRSIKAFCSGDAESIKESMTVVKGKKMKFRRKDGQDLTCNIDGEFYKTSGLSEIKIIPDKLKLIVPKGTEVRETEQ